jgi:predicted branched-subunit amino acid permease
MARMANANRVGMPGWVKVSLGVLGVAIVIGVVMVAVGHNPLQHIMGHAGMTG